MNTHGFSVRLLSLLLVGVLSGALQPVLAQPNANIFDLPVPPGSVAFGEYVTVLSNGNFVITDTQYNTDRGAVYLYSPNGVLISQLTGSVLGDVIGSGGITVLTNGNYVVSSPHWSSGTADDQFWVGAATWCSQVTGCNGSISSANSLIGSHHSDQISGSGGVFPLANGNYIVASKYWDNGSVIDAGAVTWGDGSVGTTGIVSPASSLVGSTQSDQVGSALSYGTVMTLTNGNYLIGSSAWDNGSLVDAGAVTWGNGMGGTTGAISAANSLVGTSANDQVGDDFTGHIVELANGNYVIVTKYWDLDATYQNVRAITWGSGTTGVAGPISTANSLVGSNHGIVGDLDETCGLIPLTNGNYLVRSEFYDLDPTHTDTGAVTFGSGTSGVTGFITPENSLVGSSTNDHVGEEVIALTNGNYVVNSPDWQVDGERLGAVTWGDGSGGITGSVSTANSLVGYPYGSIGSGGVIALANGNYAVSSPLWSTDNNLDPTNVGAVTWGNGATGTTGVVSAANSFVGVETYESLSDGGMVALTNGNFIFITSDWFYTFNHAGAVTWVDGSHMTTGVVSDANSLLGSTDSDDVGSGGVIALTNGNYLVLSPDWDNGGVVDAGAVTWGDGVHGTTGVVSAANSLVGSSLNDQVGSLYDESGVTELTNGNYVLSSPQWDNGTIVDAGAVTWGDGAHGTSGPVSAANSLVGSSLNDMVGDGSIGGEDGVTALLDGNYLVNSSHWTDAIGVGAVTWGNGSSGTLGPVSVLNSLVNTSAYDLTFCNSTFDTFADGNASLLFPRWSDGSSYTAATLIVCGDTVTVGQVSSANSVLGTISLGTFNPDYDPLHTQLIVGRPDENKVTILRCQSVGSTSMIYLPLIIR